MSLQPDCPVFFVRRPHASCPSLEVEVHLDLSLVDPLIILQTSSSSPPPPPPGPMQLSQASYLATGCGEYLFGAPATETTILLLCSLAVSVSFEKMDFYTNRASIALLCLVSMDVKLKIQYSIGVPEYRMDK